MPDRRIGGTLSLGSARKTEELRHKFASKQNPHDARMQRERKQKPLFWKMVEKYPLIFDLSDPKPLATNIHRDIAEELGASKKQVSSVLRGWTRRKEYRAALSASNSHRHDFDGNAVAPVSEADRTYARVHAGKHPARRRLAEGRGEAKFSGTSVPESRYPHSAGRSVALNPTEPALTPLKFRGELGARTEK